MFHSRNHILSLDYSCSDQSGSDHPESPCDESVGPHLPMQVLGPYNRPTTQKEMKNEAKVGSHLSRKLTKRPFCMILYNLRTLFAYVFFTVNHRVGEVLDTPSLQMVV